MHPYTQRQHSLQSTLPVGTAVLFADTSVIQYFTGFRAITATEREGYLLISHDQVQLFTAGFSPVPSHLESESLIEGFTLTRTINLTRVATAIHTSGVTSLQVDEAHLYVAEVKELQHHLIGITEQAFETTAFDYAHIWKLRMRKDDAEQGLIRKACSITHQVLDETLSSLRIGQSEQEIAIQIEHRFRELGADGPAFPSIVAFGEHAALPHYQPNNTRLESNTTVLIDCGARVAGYNGDMTRTVWFGDTPSEEFQTIQRAVDTAYRKGYALLKSRFQAAQVITAGELDTVVREHIREEGYGDAFIHTTGHGIGLDVHESPSIYQTNHLPLSESMIITIEPGVYLPGKMGYRYENTILLTSQDAEELTQ